MSIQHLPLLSLTCKVDRNYRNKFTFIPLPSTYLLLNQQYSQTLCYFCTDYPRKREQDLVLCLLCGEVMCNKICKRKHRLANQMRSGNISHHAISKHRGQSYFLMLSSCNTIIYDAPKVSVHTVFYFD